MRSIQPQQISQRTRSGSWAGWRFEVSLIVRPRLTLVTQASFCPMNRALTRSFRTRDDYRPLSTLSRRIKETATGSWARPLTPGELSPKNGGSKSNQNLYHLLFWAVIASWQNRNTEVRAFSRRRFEETTMDALLERKITAAQRWRILNDLMDEFEWVHGRPLRTFENFKHGWRQRADGEQCARGSKTSCFVVHCAQSAD